MADVVSDTVRLVFRFSRGTYVYRSSKSEVVGPFVEVIESGAETVEPKPFSQGTALNHCDVRIYSYGTTPSDADVVTARLNPIGSGGRRLEVQVPVPRHLYERISEGQANTVTIEVALKPGDSLVQEDEKSSRWASKVDATGKLVSVSIET